MYIRLKDFRTTHGLFQSAMAEIMGTTQSVVSRMEMRGIAEIQAPQYDKLCNKFGKDNVDAFCTDTPHVVVSGNSNRGSGQQNNGIINNNTALFNIIQRMSDSLTTALQKQSEQTDKLLTLFEKLSEKL